MHPSTLQILHSSGYKYLILSLQYSHTAHQIWLFSFSIVSSARSFKRDDMMMGYIIIIVLPTPPKFQHQPHQVHQGLNMDTMWRRV